MTSDRLPDDRFTGFRRGVGEVIALLGQEIRPVTSVSNCQHSVSHTNSEDIAYQISENGWLISVLEYPRPPPFFYKTTLDLRNFSFHSDVADCWINLGRCDLSFGRYLPTFRRDLMRSYGFNK